MVEWQQTLSIGVLEIDVQHKLLFEKFNAFLAACQAEKGTDEVQRLFWFLEAYTMTHFTEEEKLMRQLAYPDFLTHQQRHREFTGEIGKFKQRLKSEGPSQDLISSITTFISTWLIQHISNLDRAIGVYSRSRQEQDW